MTDVYEAAGGQDTVTTLVDQLYERLLVDESTSRHFSLERLPSMKATQARWFEAVLQGEPPPTHLSALHAYPDIGDQEIAAAIGHLEAVLEGLVPDERLRRAIVSLVSRLWHARRF